MKRYEELTVYKKQLDGTLVRILPEYPSRCLSIDLRTEEENQRIGNPLKNLQDSLRKK